MIKNNVELLIEEVVWISTKFGGISTLGVSEKLLMIKEKTKEEEKKNLTSL